MTGNGSHSRRRFIKTTGVSAAALAGLAGCTGDSGDASNTSGGGAENGSGGDSTASGTTTGSSGDSGSMADEITFYNAGSLKYDPGTAENIQRFEDETGITVNVNEVPWANLKTSLTTAWRNQSNKVDAFNGPTWWLADFVSAEWIAPLNLSSDHMSKFPDNLRSLLTFDGSVYMAPQLGKWGTYVYNNQLLEQAGVSEPPSTWQEVIETGQQMNLDGPAPFAMTWANKDVFTFKQLLYQAGGGLFGDGNQPNFVDAGVTVFDELLTPLRENDLLPDGIANMGEGPVGDAFVGGELAIAESWTPLGNRALGADGWEESQLGVAKPPEGPSSRATFQDTNGVAVSAFSEKKDAARRFAEFMSTTESCKTDMLVEGNPAPIPSLYEDSEIQEAYPSDLLSAMKYNLENAQSETYLAQPQVDEYLSNAITPALLGNEDPEEALTNAQSQITGLYENLGVL